MEEIQVIAPDIEFYGHSNHKDYTREGFIGKLDNSPYWFYDSVLKHSPDSFLEIMKELAEDFGAKKIYMMRWPDDISRENMIGFTRTGGVWDSENRRYSLKPQWGFFRERGGFCEFEDMAPEDIFKRNEIEIQPGVFQQTLF